eukprot:GFYU01005256.1.p1 GENE.GFYU01005256.1~~GFYU01005256.1.p1  ORF type:complete len:134 (-),score=22.32 GFYU01005256.1:15-416(-)
MQLNLHLLPSPLCICRFAATTQIPEWSLKSTEFFTISRTADELSVVCPQGDIPADLKESDSVKIDRDWRAFKVAGPLDFSLVGIMANLSDILAKSEVSIFAISTYDTDYILVKSDKVDVASAALTSGGHNVTK